MEIKQEILIENLIVRTKEVLYQAEAFKQLPTDKLLSRPGPKSWNALECLEHLNYYGDFYIPEISKRLQNAPSKPSDDRFKSGLLGNYFAKGMLPKEQLNKMKTFKSMNPDGEKLDKSVVDRFIAQQKKILQLLQTARAVDLTKTKTSISISKLIKLRLGDTFRVVIYHNQRHIVQAKKALGQPVSPAADTVQSVEK